MKRIILKLCWKDLTTKKTKDAMCSFHDRPLYEIITGSNTKIRCSHKDCKKP